MSVVTAVPVQLMHYHRVLSAVYHCCLLFWVRNTTPVLDKCHRLVPPQTAVSFIIVVMLYILSRGYLIKESGFGYIVNSFFTESRFGFCESSLNPIGDEC